MDFLHHSPTVADVVTLRAKMGVRYWEDGEVNGATDEDGSLIPLRNGDYWLIDVDLASGKIANWPEGVTASTHYKVCDDGVYTLLGPDGDEVISMEGCVPAMLAPKGGGYGDYVILDIGQDGVIAGWKADLSFFHEEA